MEYQSLLLIFADIAVVFLSSISRPSRSIRGTPLSCVGGMLLPSRLSRLEETRLLTALQKNSRQHHD
jgi:hypothetical protein